MYCYFCGKKNSDEHKFCKYCGKSLRPVETGNEKAVIPGIKQEEKAPAAENKKEVKASDADDREEVQISVGQIEKNVQSYTGEAHPDKAGSNGNKSGIKGLLVAVIVLLSLLIVALGVFMFITLNGNAGKQKDNEVSEREAAEVSDNKTEETIEIADSEENSVNEEEPADEKENTVEKAIGAEEAFGLFLKDEITASVFGKDTLYSDMQKEYETDGYEYRDVDNDGEDEMLIYSEFNFYPVVALDVVDGEIRDLCCGEGTAGYLRFYEHEGNTLACYSDTSHQGRQWYSFVQYNGTNIVDRFSLSVEYWDNPNDWYDENSVFKYRDKEITMEEYEALLKDYTGIESKGLETSSTEITIDSTSSENYSGVTYRGYHSSLGSDNFSFIYPVNLYKSVSHDYGINEEELYGTLIERAIFYGAAGSSLEYKMYRRSQAYSKEDMLNAVYLGELQNMLVIPGADPNIRAPKVDKGYGLAVISGWTQDVTRIVYEVIEVEADYILIMRMTTPDTAAAKTVTSDLYDGCGFNAAKLWE